MATSNYFSDEDEASGSAGGVIGGGGGGGGAPAAAPSSGGGGSGFVNLQSYLDANQGGSSGVADTLSQDFGGQVAGSNQDITNLTTREQNTAHGLDTAGVVGPNVSQGAENQALAGLSNYGMSDATSGAYDKLGRDQTALRGQADALANDQHSRQEAIQRLYGSGRSSGFGALDSFLVGADESSGFRDKVAGQTAQLGDVEAGRSAAQGAYDTANTQRRDNTVSGYQDARAAEDAARVKEQAAMTADVGTRAPGTNPMGGIAGTGADATNPADYDPWKDFDSEGQYSEWGNLPEWLGGSGKIEAKADNDVKKSLGKMGRY